MRKLAWFSVPFVAYTLIGCTAEEEEGSKVELPISSSQAALSATQNSEQALNGLLNAVEFLGDSESFAAVFEMFEDEGGCSTAAPYCEPSAGDCPAVEDVCLKVADSPQGMDDEAEELRQDIEELIEFLETEVFIEPNIESITDTSVTYRLGADLLCNDNGPGTAPDADCVERIATVQPRLHLTSPKDGDIDLTLMVGEDRHTPIQLQLYAESLGIQVDLGQTLEVARDLGDVPDDLDSLSGVVQLQLIENATMDYSVRVNVLEAIEVSARTEENEPIQISLEASSPTLELNANGNTETLEFTQDWNAFRFLAPLASIASDISSDEETVGPYPDGDFAAPPAEEPEPEKVYTGVVELFLAGLNYTVSYTADSDEIAIRDWGYGDTTSTLKHNDNTLLSFDVNEQAGRKLSATLKKLEDDGVQVVFNPSLDYKLKFAFQHIADQFDELPSFLLDDTLQVQLTGDTPTVELTEGQFKLASGNLALTSLAVPAANLSLEAGMCLGEAETDGSEEPAHEILSSLAIVTCQ